jgi:plasmid stability protein
VKHLTIRELPDDLARALEKEKRRRGQSLNRTVKDLLRQSLALDGNRGYSNGLGKLAGGWSKADLESFEKATAVFERIDPDVWK